MLNDKQDMSLLQATMLCSTNNETQASSFLTASPVPSVPIDWDFMKPVRKHTLVSVDREDQIDNPDGFSSGFFFEGSFDD